jgi:hypothetical protein
VAFTGRYPEHADDTFLRHVRPYSSDYWSQAVTNPVRRLQDQQDAKNDDDEEQILFTDWDAKHTDDICMRSSMSWSLETFNQSLANPISGFGRSRGGP